MYLLHNPAVDGLGNVSQELFLIQKVISMKSMIIYLLHSLHIGAFDPPDPGYWVIHLGNIVTSSLSLSTFAQLILLGIILQPLPSLPTPPCIRLGGMKDNFDLVFKKHKLPTNDTFLGTS